MWSGAVGAPDVGYRQNVSAKVSELIYDWNTIYAKSMVPAGKVLLNDETLRDGLQSPSVKDPTIEQKIEILHLMEAVGIDMLDIGLPGAGPRAVAHCEALAREIGRARLKIKPNCAARTHENDIRPIAEIVQRTGVPIEAATFIGSSPIRRYTEDWTDDFLLRTTEKAVKFAVSLGLEVMYVTEDTTRCDPETIKRLYSTAISCGAHAIVICDTAGHATPMGTVALMHFVVNEVVKPSGQDVRVEWHGHCDRGLAVANSIAALVAGAEVVHGTACGIGERVGNTQMDQMLVNLKLMGIEPWATQELNRLKEYCDAVPCHWHTYPGELSGGGRRRLPHRYRCACGCGHQGLSQERCDAREQHLLGRPFPLFRDGTDHRDRPHERQVERALLAGTPRHSRHSRTGGAHLRAGQEFRDHAH